jgi:hypothetical protein
MMGKQPVLYPKMYLWYVALASLDVLLTMIVLQLGGIELNGIARWIMEQSRSIDDIGFAGMTFFKFATVMFVLVSCEIVGRRRSGLGKSLAEWAVAINTIPVGVATLQLLDPAAM